MEVGGNGLTICDCDSADPAEKTINRKNLWCFRNIWASFNMVNVKVN